ncbi:hypothetical protein K438DRAFT_121332 [Mycena galopus ATCC 62051]|nr:hypothetical protein K438DRAFT_121332 [Mycena galopus ATCC 62051]
MLQRLSFSGARFLGVVMQHATIQALNLWMVTLRTSKHSADLKSTAIVAYWLHIHYLLAFNARIKFSTIDDRSILTSKLFTLRIRVWEI